MNSDDTKQRLDALSKRAVKSDCSGGDCCRSSPLTSIHLTHSCHSAPLTSHGLADPAVGFNVDTLSSRDPVLSLPYSTNRTRPLIYPAPMGFSYQESATLPLPVSLSMPLPLSFVPPTASVPPTSASSLAVAVAARRRSRGEKKPTPEDQKDQRYLERRRRNNTAAKKSRDARRAREDQIALRACILEHENAVLRAQLIAVRNESDTLRTLFLSRRSESAENTLQN